jgi:hypothetical protein
VHPLADAQGLLCQLVNGSPGCLLGVGSGVSRADLTDDLLLAHHHGVQAARDREQVLYCGFAVAHVQVLGQIVDLSVRVPREHLSDVGQRTVKGVHNGVDLHAVAGGHQHGLGDPRRAQQLLE